MDNINIRFAGYPSAVVYEKPDGKNPIQHLLWGDWLLLKEGRIGNYCEVHARKVDGWVRSDLIQPNRLLEIVFVDIGQGDGCLVVTPDDKHMVIDAGEEDNMARFLNWRYGNFDDPWEFECAVISHPDSDHYKGFKNIFNLDNVRFKTIYHNGIVERNGEDRLGPKTTFGNFEYLTDVIRTYEDLQRLLTDPATWKRKQYLEMINDAIVKEKFDDFKMLGHEDKYMEGYGPEKDLSIKLLGPVLERGCQNKPMLRWFGDVGKTKNGHSIVLRLQYHNVSIMLGGDLNIPAEDFLLNYHTGLTYPPAHPEEYPALVEAARKVFQVDVAKTCHHGSSDFSIPFISALNPIVSVISSGDNESYSHPRSDVLGSIGRYSRGVRPLIFSTELARSANDTISHPNFFRAEFKKIITEIINITGNTPEDIAKRAELEKKHAELTDKINRSIAVYGAINLRTDGYKVVMAQKIEKPSSNANKWDIYRLEAQGTGPLTYQSKY